MTKTRIEEDSLGEIEVPADGYYGAQTERARRNFPVSGLRFPRRFIAAMGMIKRGAAEVNVEMGIVSQEIADAIVQASDEVIAGRLDKDFPLDIFQTGSGTSTNMNT
ncbi:MAG: aspartate ammonia-lyase, partial [Acidobacteria bacterium]|nr:aspartate ammonia-lyase [Acidobacteriota bacterium]